MYLSTQNKTAKAPDLRYTHTEHTHLALPGHAQVDVTTEPVEAVIKNSLSDNLGQRLMYIKVDSNVPIASTLASHGRAACTPAYWLPAARATLPPLVLLTVPATCCPQGLACAATRATKRELPRVLEVRPAACRVLRTQCLQKIRFE